MAYIMHYNLEQTSIPRLFYESRFITFSFCKMCRSHLITWLVLVTVIVKWKCITKKKNCFQNCCRLHNLRQLIKKSTTRRNTFYPKKSSFFLFSFCLWWNDMWNYSSVNNSKILNVNLALPCFKLTIFSVWMFYWKEFIHFVEIFLYIF